MSNDTIGDMLTRIRNANMVEKRDVLVPKSKMTFQIAQLLVSEGFIKSVELSKEDPLFLSIQLKYLSNGCPVLTNLERISKPGRRLYVQKEFVPKVLGGIGIVILSTSKGIMSDRMARERKLGGELLCSIY